VVNTYLGAHAFPPDADRDDHVRQVVRTAAEVGESGLAEFCDVYCDEGYFTVAETEAILTAGVAAGLAPKVHLDAYSHTGAAALAAALPATSADHLNHTTAAELRLMAEAGVVGVHVPLLDFAAAHPVPARVQAIIDAGMELALATDACPGANVLSMQLVIAYACRAGGLDVARAVRAATLGGARALGLASSVGSLEAGKRADLLVLDLPRFDELGYRIGGNAVETVIKHGEIVPRGAA
jgi:imidazolonepropionase